VAVEARSRPEFGQGRERSTGVGQGGGEAEAARELAEDGGCVAASVAEHLAMMEQQAEGVKHLGIDFPPAAAELVEEQRWDRSQFQIAGEVVGGSLFHRLSVAARGKGLVADEGPLTLASANGFQDANRPLAKARTSGCRAEEHRGEHFAPGMPRLVTSFRHGGSEIQEAEDLVEITLKPSPAQDCGGTCFWRRKRRRLMAQMRPSTCWKRRCSSTPRRTCRASAGFKWTVFSLPSTSTDRANCG
jgi:hypothetical protein